MYPSFEDKIIVFGTITVIVLTIIGLIAFPFIKFSTTGNGEHSGYISAIEQKGIFFKNYKVYFKTDNQSSQEDVYCLNRNQLELIKKAKESNIARKLVTVEYKGVFGWGLDICAGEEIKDIK